MIREFWEKIKKIKHIEIYAAIILCVAALVVFFADFGGKTTTVVTEENWEEQILSNVTEIVSNIEGVGKVSIAITYDSGLVNEYLYETKTETNSGSTTSTSEIVSYKGEPIVLRELYPAIKGVVVVAEGGDKTEVKYKIIKALVTLLGIDGSQIEVFGYKK